MEILYYAWEMFTGMEKNGWWLMMVVFTLTCITFIITNISIRQSIQKIEKILQEQYLLILEDKEDL